MYQAGKHHPAAPSVRAPHRVFATCALLVAGLASACLITGCGNEYRPVVSAINPVGPAGQPEKYAVAVSSPSPTTPGLVTYVDFSGDTVLSTPNILANPSYYAISQGSSQGYVINPAGSLNNFGLFNPESIITSTIGQTTLAANANPVSITAVALSGSSSNIFIPEASSSQVAILTSASGVAPSLLQNLAVGANPVYVVGSEGAARAYALSEGSTPGGNGTIASIEALSNSALAVSATIPVGIAPVYGVMTPDDRRAFILNRGSGTVSVVNVVNNALDDATPTIALPAINGGVASPVWADLSTVSNQVVVLNAANAVNASGQNYQGTYSASTAYSQNAVVSYNGGLYLDTSSTSLTGVAPTNAASWSLLSPGTLSIVDVPLCNANAQTTNPNCNPANPVDAAGFGQIVANPTVGIGPTMVSVLADGSAAYVINQFDSTGTCAAGQGSVSVVDLQSGKVINTLCGEAGGTGTTSDGLIHGHPNSVSATTGNPTGKVYVTASDSPDLSVIYTDTNTVQTHITLQGLGLRVLVSAP